MFRAATVKIFPAGLRYLFPGRSIVAPSFQSTGSHLKRSFDLIEHKEMHLMGLRLEGGVWEKAGLQTGEKGSGMAGRETVSWTAA